MEYGSYFLTALGSRIPVMIIWLVGFVFALLRWKRHPLVSLLIVAGLVVQFLSSLLGVVSGILPLYLHNEMAVPLKEANIYLGVVSVINIILGTVGWALLVAALFIKRKPAAE